MGHPRQVHVDGIDRFSGDFFCAVAAPFPLSDDSVGLCPLHPLTSFNVISFNPLESFIPITELAAQLSILDLTQDV